MKKYKLAVLGANTPLLPFYSKMDRSLFEIYGFAWAEGAVCKKFCDYFYDISILDADAILEVCREKQVDGITSFSLESAVPTLTYVASKLGLPCNSSLVSKWTGHKGYFRQILEDAGLYMPKSVTVKSSELPNNLELPLCPLIVKPADGGGSKGVSLIHEPKDLASAISYALQYSRSSEVVIEEYIDGSEFSVEYLSYKGSHYYLTITDKTTSGEPYFVELAHHQPTNLPEDMVSTVKSVVEQALTALGITNSPSHTELRINKKGIPVIIEVGPRLGGDFITSDLVQMSTGYDLVNNTCLMACGILNIPENLLSREANVLFNTTSTSNKIKEVLASHIDSKHMLSPLNIDCKNNSERSGYIIY